jgi:tetratricopeptide (TPR) repeat protein
VVERIDSTEEAGQHTLFLLAGYLKSEGASEGAERVLRKAMELWRDREAEDPLISRVVLRDLAIVSMEGQRLDEASELLERALTLGEDADILTHLGLVAMRRGDPGQAEIHFRRASELSEDDPFCSDEYSAEILTLLGLTSAQLGRGEDAEVCYDRAIALAETPETVKAFAKFLVEQGRHRKAVGQWEQALQLLENGTDRDDAKIAPLRVNYIRALIAGGDLEKADEELSREIRGTEAAHGRDARVLVDWLYDRGGVLRDLYRYDQAAEQYDRAIAIQKLHNEEKSTYAASVLLERGWCYYRLGRYEEAEETYRQTLAIWDQADDSLNRAHTLRYVANLLAETGRVDEAAEHYQKALRTYENSDSDTDYHIAATLVGMGLMKNQTGERRSARELYRRALACFERLYGAKHLSVASVLANLGSSYLADERYVDAEEAYRRALTIFRTVSAGDEHPTIATIMNGLATALVHQDRPDEAEAFVPPPA